MTAKGKKVHFSNTGLQ